MALKLANNAVSQLAANVAVGATTLSVTPGDGAKFPTLGAGDWFPLTVVKSSGALEIMRCTARTTDTLTVSRAQEGTAALAFSAGDRVELRWTSAAYLDVSNRADAAQTAANAAQSTANAALPKGGGTMAGLLTGATISMSMDGNDTNSGSFKCRSTGTGDANLAGMSFNNDAYAIKMGVRADGYFGIGGWSRPAWSWYSDPNGNMVSAGNVSAYSDPLLKKDVERIRGALWIIQQLDGVRFTWNGRTHLIGRPGARDIGVLADQVEAVLPEIVGRSVPDEGNDGQQWRVVAYDKLVPVLIEAVKEIADRLAKLEDAQ
jgi:hypothetical protein